MLFPDLKAGSIRAFLSILMLVGGLALSAATADEPQPIAVKTPVRTEPVSYSREVAEILSAKCLACHNASLAENRLDMEEPAGMIKGGKNGPSLVAGNAEASLLFKMAAHRVEPVMPPKEKKDLSPLTSEELGLLKLWIDAGAKEDSEESPVISEVEIGTLPPGLHAVNAVDMTADGLRFACGRANLVQVVDVDSGREIISLAGHKDFVQSIKFSPNGRLLAAGGYQSVALWDVPAGGLVSTFEGHGEPVQAVVSLDEGKRFASTALDKTVRLWDSVTGKPLQTFAVVGQAASLAVGSDGKAIAVGCLDGAVQVISSQEGGELAKFKGHNGPVNAVAFLDENRRLATVADEGAKVWSLGAGPSEPLGLKGHQGPVRSAIALPDGKTLATSGDDATVRFWNIDSGKLLKTMTLSGGAIRSIAVDQAGNWLAAGCADGSARVFDLKSETLTRTLKGRAGSADSVAFNPGGDRIATAGVSGGVKVWETETGRGVLAFGHTAVAPGKQAPNVASVAFLRDDLAVSASADKTLKTWRFEGRWSENRRLGPHAFRVLAVDFNPDGTLLAAGGGEPSRSGEIKLWEVGKGMLVRTLDTLHSDTVFSLKFSPDGSKLASAGADKFLKITRVEDGKEYRSYEGHTNHVMAADWRSDGQQIASAGADLVLKVWDVESGEQLKTLVGAAKQITSIRWIPGKPEIVGASADQTVRLWNADNGQVVRNYAGSTDYVFAVAASNDGKRIIAGGEDGAIYLWDASNGQLLQKFEP